MHAHTYNQTSYLTLKITTALVLLQRTASHHRSKYRWRHWVIFITNRIELHLPSLLWTIVCNHHRYLALKIATALYGTADNSISLQKQVQKAALISKPSSIYFRYDQIILTVITSSNSVYPPQYQLVTWVCAQNHDGTTENNGTSLKNKHRRQHS